MAEMCDEVVDHGEVSIEETRLLKALSPWSDFSRQPGRMRFYIREAAARRELIVRLRRMHDEMPSLAVQVSSSEALVKRDQRYWLRISIADEVVNRVLSVRVHSYWRIFDTAPEAVEAKLRQM